MIYRLKMVIFLSYVSLPEGVMRVYIYICVYAYMYQSPPLPYQILVIVGIPQLIDPVRLVRGEWIIGKKGDPKQVRIG